jgi:EAL domain-containing protein (putative c-di-GMP-specific phosphodiesterase class I)
VSSKPHRRKIDRLLNGDHLALHYQPIFSVATRRMISAEALLRVKDDQGDVVRGGDVAEEAEEGDEIFALQERVTWSAFHDAARWHAEGIDWLRLNLNLSARQFCDPHLVEGLEELIAESGIRRDLLNLEITETSYIEDRASVIPVLERFRDDGIHLWLDDFGTGHSSMSHLIDFPVEGLKLPGEFVKNICSSDRARTVVGSVVGLAHALAMEVVAEEVEREDQLAELEKLECDAIQGFLFSPALTLKELISKGLNDPNASREASST